MQFTVKGQIQFSLYFQFSLPLKVYLTDMHYYEGFKCKRVELETAKEEEKEAKSDFDKEERKFWALLEKTYFK